MGKKIIIIGGGVAGLSAGIYGQRSGFDTEIIEMPIKEGDEVKKGELLMVIKPDMYIQAYNRALASLSSAQARLAQKLSDEETATVHASLVHATTQLKVKRLRKK